MSAEHPLKKWIKDHSSQAQFARGIDCSESHLSDILSGNKQPSLALAIRMSEATGKAVSLDAIAARMPRPEKPAEATVAA